jgi:hypothetical protein
LVSDGPLSIDTPILIDWKVSSTPSQHGSAQSFVRTLRLALSLDPDLDHLTFVEDDVEMSLNSLPYIARLQVPGDVAFVTWFTYDYDYSSPPHTLLEPHPSTLDHPVLACRSSRYFILTQCCTFPRRTVERILDCPLASANWPKRDAHDELISWALGDSPYAVHFPILIQHTGGLNSAVSFDRARSINVETDLVSSLSDPQAGARTCPYYAGPNFNAMSLIP